jgi:hypothetical protein
MRCTEVGTTLIGVALLVSGATRMALAQGAPLHQRQCVPTGEVEAADLKKVTITWKKAFPDANYSVIGSVADSSPSAAALQLNHILLPLSPTSASAIVMNNSPGQARSGIVCLDAEAQ